MLLSETAESLALVPLWRVTSILIKKQFDDFKFELEENVSQLPNQNTSKDTHTRLAICTVIGTQQSKDEAE